MNDHLYDEIIEENENKFKKNKFKKRKHILKDKFDYLLTKYYSQFGERKNKVLNYSLKKIKFNLELEIYDPKTRFTTLEFIEVVGWKIPNSWVLSSESIYGVYNSFKQAKNAFDKKYYNIKKNKYIINIIQDKLKKSFPNASSLGLCYSIRIKNEIILKERKVSYIQKEYNSIIDIETKETENSVFYKRNLRKTRRGFVGKDLYIVRPFKKDPWDTYKSKKDILNKIIKKEYLEELKFPF